MVIKESGAKITCDKLPRIIGDETLITQLFQNLISNAIKFRKPKVSPQVHVSAKREENDWIFSVKDNGIGVAPENYDRIFEIYKRLHDQSEYPGTGVGLALCKRIVEFHDGKIWVESEYGKGTTFHISLPQEKNS